jgi:hypothetical protein
LSISLYRLADWTLILYQLLHTVVTCHITVLYIPYFIACFCLPDSIVQIPSYCSIHIAKMELLASCAVLYSGTQNLHYFLYYIIVWLHFLLLCLLQYGNSPGMIDTYHALKVSPTDESGEFSGNWTFPFHGPNYTCT